MGASCCSTNTTQIKINTNINHGANTTQNKNIIISDNDKLKRFLITKAFNYDNSSLSSIDFLNKINQGLSIVNVLSAENNKLNSLPTDFISNLTELKKINMKRNIFKSIPDVILFSNCSKTIKNIDFSHNNINSLNNLEKSNLDSLIELNLSSNSIDYFPEVKMNYLTILDIRSNNIVNFPYSLLKITTLERLFLNNNKISLIKNDKLKQNDSLISSNLVHLDISYNNLFTIPSEFLLNSKLSNLNLKGNKIKLSELRNIDGYESFLERRKVIKNIGFQNNLDINFDICGLDNN